jgi:hypothetical protein
MWADSAHIFFPCCRQKTFRFNTGVVEQVSLDLKREFPDAEGFSASNLWRMKQWFLFYTAEPCV